MSVFEIEYSYQGERVTRQVEGLQTAMQVARKLAMETGKRTVIRRMPEPARADWLLFLLDLKTGKLSCVRDSLTKRQVLQRWKAWDERTTGLAVVAWPNGG